MLSNMANVTDQGYNQAYQQAAQQFNVEQQQGQQAQEFANQFGLQALANQVQAGQLQRNIEQEGRWHRRCNEELPRLVGHHRGHRRYNGYRGRRRYNGCSGYNHSVDGKRMKELRNGN